MQKSDSTIRHGILILARELRAALGPRGWNKFAKTSPKGVDEMFTGKIFFSEWGKLEVREETDPQMTLNLLAKTLSRGLPLSIHIHLKSTSFQSLDLLFVFLLATQKIVEERVTRC